MRGRGILSLGLAVILFVFGMPRAFAQLDELKNTTPGERASAPNGAHEVQARANTRQPHWSVIRNVLHWVS